jgi:hydrogenase maturation protein HypF
MKADGNLFIEEPSALHNSYRWIIDGTVQGVGFRPFVFRVASELNLTGWVKNRVGEVEILTQGTAADQEAFGQALVNQAPPLARPQLRCREPVDTELFSDFRILESDATGDSRISVPKDLFMCDDCGAELHTPGNPRFRYPFINCTQCGPRYTLIRSLPYDRGHTSMAPFELCPTCRGEYFDPADRRFHAEPIACPRCGPCLTFQREGTAEVEMEAALRQATAALAEGRIVAVKGLSARAKAPTAQAACRDVSVGRRRSSGVPAPGG